MSTFTSERDFEEALIKLQTLFTIRKTMLRSVRCHLTTDLTLRLLKFLLLASRSRSKLIYFSQSLDHLLTLHQRKLEKLQNIKKSLLEKMFV
jgi:hypothetical protein